MSISIQKSSFLIDRLKECERPCAVAVQFFSLQIKEVTKDMDKIFSKSLVAVVVLAFAAKKMWIFA